MGTLSYRQQHSEGDQYSYADSQYSDRGHSDDEGDIRNEPLLDSQDYRKLHDLNRCAQMIQIKLQLVSCHRCRLAAASWLFSSCKPYELASNFLHQ